MKIIGVVLAWTILSISCNTKEIVSKDKLIGKWSATKIDGVPIAEHGFESIVLELKTNDSFELVSALKTQGNFIVTIAGQWKMENKFNCKIAEEWKESNIELTKNKLLFFL